MLSINQTFNFNTKLYQHSYFPIPVRSSALERIKRHTLNFAGITSAFSLGYHFLTLNFKFAVAQALKCLVHKTVIGLTYFYANEIVWAWVAKTRQESLRQQHKLRISNWSVNLVTVFLIFPLLLGINMVYKLPSRKKIFKTIADSLLLAGFSMEFDRSLRSQRNILLNGTKEQKKRFLDSQSLF